MKGCTNCGLGDWTLLVDDRVLYTGDEPELAKKRDILAHRGHNVLLRRSRDGDRTDCVTNENEHVGESVREWKYKRYLAGATLVSVIQGTYHYVAQTDTGQEFTVFGEDLSFFNRLADRLGIDRVDTI